jgi:hypothetical protein
MKAVKTIFAAARRLARQWQVMAVLAAVYASLLAALFFFVATTEATLWQIMWTLSFAALAPALFFLLQAMIVNYARGETSPSRLLRRSFRDSSKLALVSLPLALAFVLFLYFLNKLQSYFPGHDWSPAQTTSEMWPAGPRRSSTGSAGGLQWAVLMWTTLRFLLFGFVLPLIAVHLWSASARDGLLPVLRRAHQHLSRAFRADAVLTYAVGLLLFGLIPYVLLFTHTPAAKPSIEFGLFVARLLLVFVFTLYGWVLTLDALAGDAGNAGNANATGSSDPATS